MDRVKRNPKRVVFAEGEEEQVIRAAVAYVNQGLGSAILVGREERVTRSPTMPGSNSTKNSSKFTMPAFPTATRLCANAL